MNTRIRYIKDHTGNLVSTRVFNDIQVFLNTEKLEYLLVNASTQVLKASGTATSLNMLKIKVKKSLKDLGVSFGEENRNRVTSSQ